MSVPYQLNNPDMRVVIIKDYVRSNFPASPLLEYALEVEKITTSKVHVHYTCIIFIYMNNHIPVHCTCMYIYIEHNYYWKEKWEGGREGGRGKEDIHDCSAHHSILLCNN